MIHQQWDHRNPKIDNKRMEAILKIKNFRKLFDKFSDYWFEVNCFIDFSFPSLHWSFYWYFWIFRRNGSFETSISFVLVTHHWILSRADPLGNSNWIISTEQLQLDIQFIEIKNLHILLEYSLMPGKAPESRQCSYGKSGKTLDA